MQTLRSTLNTLRDKYAPVSHVSTFRETGQITPEEFVLAGDFLVYKFPSWHWSGAPPSKRVTYLPDDKQYLITRGVPCHRRLDKNFAGDAGHDETIVRDGDEFGGENDEERGWLRTGEMDSSQQAKEREVRTVDDHGELGEREEEEEIPDMEDEEDDDEAIIREKNPASNAPTRTYTLYITYTPYYRTPRLYLLGYKNQSEPLEPSLMMEDIVGDYKDKTVTLEDMPFSAPPVKTASVHPCRHASVMKVLLDRADAALKLRVAKIKGGKESASHIDSGLEGLVDDTQKLQLTEQSKAAQAQQQQQGGDEWEVLPEQHEGDDVAIRVDQYLVVFLKFMASVTPGIEHDFTMGV